MDKVHKTSDSDRYTSSSEPFGFFFGSSCEEWKRDNSLLTFHNVKGGKPGQLTHDHNLWHRFYLFMQNVCVEYKYNEVYSM
jgi:hypothetical protein